jgi:uncharacterized protein YbbC (DUF1343 family)
MYIDNYYINKLSNIKYPDSVSQYNMTEKATINIIKKFKKEVSTNDIIEIIEYKSRNGNDNKKFIIDIIKVVFESNLKFKKEDLERIFSSFNNIIDFINFINRLSNEEIFVGGDLEKSWKWNMKFEDLLNCRSYKIWSISNE